MSLNWDLTKIKNYEELYRKDDDGNTELYPMTERLIFLAMEIDLMNITENSVDEWLVRLEMMKKVGWSPRKEICRADIERHIGLRTNVASKTRSQFKAKLAKHIEHEAEDAVRKAKRDARAA